MSTKSMDTLGSKQVSMQLQIYNWKEQANMHLGKVCLICQKGKHHGLVQCVRLKEHIPVSTNARSPNESLCTLCLGIITQNGFDCNHQGQRAWERSSCPVGKFSYLLCSKCTQHLTGQVWWRKIHNSRIGFKEPFKILRELPHVA